jgi:hypothetical protein
MIHFAFSLLAFGFGNPWLLAGLAFGAIPVVIHLLHKRNYRETSWAAMRFLLAAARKNAQRIRFEQLLLLATRVLILVLLALALAQPYVDAPGAALDSTDPTHRVIVVDSSFSMGHRALDESAFDRAHQTARSIVSGSNRGDVMNLLRIAGTSPRVIIREPAFQIDRILEEIDGLKITQELGDLAATLHDVRSLLQLKPDIPRKEIYLISDFQRSSWLPTVQEERDQIRRDLREIANLAHIALIDVGNADAANSAVTDFASQETFVTVDREVSFQATLRNFGPVDLPDRWIELHIDGRLARRRQVDLPVLSDTVVHFAHLFPISGDHRVEVRLQEDPLPIDNRRLLVVPVKEQANLLVVNGRPTGRSEDDAAHYLATVLSPSTSREPWHGFTRPHVINEGELSATATNKYECIFLCNIELFTDNEAEILKSYAEAGGSLVFCLGDQVRAENYNLVLYREGKGVLPARLGETVGDAGLREQSFAFDAAALEHPIVHVFDGYPGAGLESTLTFAYVRTQIPENSPARVALRFETGDPVIVETAVGRGRAILITTSVDASWSAWPVQASFPPLIHEIVKFAVAGRFDDRHKFVGEPLSRLYPHATVGRSVLLRQPDGSEQSLPLSDSANSPRIFYAGTNQSGHYEFVLDPTSNDAAMFAVNVDPRESDPAKAAEDELRTRLMPGVDFNYGTAWDGEPHGASTETRKRGELTYWLLIGAFSLVLIEPLLAWRFEYGLLALSVVTVAGLLRAISAWSGPVALIGGVVIIGVSVFLLVRRRREHRFGKPRHSEAR